MLGYLSLDIICSSQLTVFLERSLLLGTDNVSGQISVHIFAPNVGYCLYIFAPNVGRLFIYFRAKCRLLFICFRAKCRLLFIYFRAKCRLLFIYFRAKCRLLFIHFRAKCRLFTCLFISCSINNKGGKFLKKLWYCFGGSITR